MERVVKCEHGRGCPYIRSERIFPSTLGGVLDLWEEHPEELYYVAFDANVANMVFDHVSVDEVCGHKLDRTAVDAFLTKKTAKMPMFDWPSEQLEEIVGPQRIVDTPMHCAAESNHFFQLSGQKIWSLIDPTYAAEMGMIHDNLVQNAPAMGSYNKFCVPHYEIDLYPGDLLYIPPWWFHDVINLPHGDGEDHQYVYGMATRFLEAQGAIMAHPLQGTYKVLTDYFFGRMSTTDAQNTLLTVKEKHGLRVAGTS